MIPHSSSGVIPDDFEYISKLGINNFVGQGELCQSFSNSLSQRFKKLKCILTTSGGSSLEIALRELKLRKPLATQVVISSYVCPAVVSAIMREGLRPVFVDVQKDSLNIDSREVEKVLGKNTLTVIMTHLGGIADPIDDLLGLDVSLISDCAQGLGTTWRKQDLATYGDFSIASFGSTKILTSGSGGALLTDDIEIFNSANRYSNEELAIQDYVDSGFTPTYGQHFSDLNAGLGLAQLNRFDMMLKRRKEIASRYSSRLKDRNGIHMPKVAPECEHNNFRYYFLSSSSSKWLSFFREHGIDARSSISHNMIDYFKEYPSFPNLTKNVSRIVSLPIHMALSDLDIYHIESVIEQGIALGL